MNNLYWSIYKNLEKEVLGFADMIHFDDNQLSVYSVRITDLLIRCAVEIEAISKELYEQTGGNMEPLDVNGKTRSLFFDTDCLDLLENKWVLSKKQAIISNINSYFENDTNRIFTPLNNANKRGKCDWKKAYQDVKHNRAMNLEKGNIKNLIRILSALYILNIYYKNESFILHKAQKLPSDSLGSSMFSFKTATCKPRFLELKRELNDDELSAIYIIKPTSEGCTKYYKEATNSFARQRVALTNAGYCIDENHDIQYADIYNIAASTGGADLVRKISELEQPALKIIDTFNYEAVLNMNPILLYSNEITGGN